MDKDLVLVTFQSMSDMNEIELGMYLELETRTQTYVGKFEGLDGDTIMLESINSKNIIGFPFNAVYHFWMDRNEYEHTDHYHYGL